MPEYWPLEVSLERAVVPRFIRLTNQEALQWQKSKDFMLYEGIGKNPFLKFVGQDIKIKSIIPYGKEAVYIVDKKGRCCFYNHKKNIWSEIHSLLDNCEVLGVVMEQGKLLMFWQTKNNEIMSGIVEENKIKNVRREEVKLDGAIVIDICGFKQYKCMLVKTVLKDNKCRVALYRKDDNGANWKKWKDIATYNIKADSYRPKAMQVIHGALCPIVNNHDQIKWCVSICDQTKSETTVYISK